MVLLDSRLRNRWLRKVDLEWNFRFFGIWSFFKFSLKPIQNFGFFVHLMVKSKVEFYKIFSKMSNTDNNWVWLSGFKNMKKNTSELSRICSFENF